VRLFGVLLFGGAAQVQAQRLDLNTGIDIYGIASSNPDLAPKGEEKGDIRLIVNPTFQRDGHGWGTYEDLGRG